jgi:hypothetical protein
VAEAEARELIRTSTEVIEMAERQMRLNREVMDNRRLALPLRLDANLKWTCYGLALRAAQRIKAKAEEELAGG